MQNSTANPPMSASQEISLMTRARKLDRLITSMGLRLPLRLLAYDSTYDLRPLAMRLMRYGVDVVNSDPEIIQRFEQHLGPGDDSITFSSYPLLEIGEHVKQICDVVLVNGLVLKDLRTDSQLQKACQQLAATIKPDGLLLISSADFDDVLRVKERVLRPRITDEHKARHIHTIVRDWHGNGYEYTETHYDIKDGEGLPTVTRHRYLRRAWRFAEITLALSRAGFEDFQWQSPEQNERIITARKSSTSRSN